jgi:hypothetical protein
VTVPGHDVPRRLWRLARPGGMVLVVGLPAAGYGFAHWEWAAPEAHLGDLLVLASAWWWLSAGTLWLNASLDQGDGEVLMGPRPEEVPHLQAFGYAALAAALATGLPLSPGPWACLAACVGLAVAYSHPATAWKGHALLGPAVNVLGYGVLSPLAGWWQAGLPATPRGAASLLLVATWVAGTYFGAQAFQEAEDRARGYHTLVALYGPREVVVVTRTAFAVSFVGMVLLASLGWFPRLLLGLAPAYLWLDGHLQWWILHPEGGVDAARTMLRRATALAVAVLLGATVAHVDGLLHSRTPAGRDTGTRFGPPTERRFAAPLPRVPWSP